MDRLREYFWLWTIIGMIFVSVVIGLVFFYINRWISKKAESQANSLPDQTSKSPEFYVQSKSYHPKYIEEDTPPLPPRTQFDTCPEADSYENLSEPPDYVCVEEEVVTPPYTEVLSRSDELRCDNPSVSSEDYDDIGKDEGSDAGQSEEDYDDVG